MKTVPYATLVAAIAAWHGSAGAFTFESGDISGSFDSTLSAGTGMRLQDPSCGLVLVGAQGSGAPAGCTQPASGLGDQGNLNYAQGDRFTTYLKGSHELLLKMPGDLRFMARATWVRDVSATHTTGFLSASPTVGGVGSDGLTDEARSDLRFKARLLDLWVSKSFEVGEQRARVRVGNQVVSWGESLFLPGGINATNAVDIMRLSQPGTQLKEAILPAPMVSVASGLGHGFNAEAYVQTNWNASYFPPTGSYWSIVNGLGKGDRAYELNTVQARNGGQWGVALRYQPEGTQLNLGLYGMNYHDKTPQFGFDPSGTPNWVHVEDRKLVGISANFPLGEWAIGTELSYRPRDAVSLNPLTGCASQGGKCWVDEKRLQWHLTGLLSLTPSNAGGFLDAIGAQTATLLAETAVIRYPGLKSNYGGDLVSAGGWGWGLLSDPNGTPQAAGTRTSWGYAFDFSVVYDGTLLPGWQVTPGIYFQHAVNGRTPNAVALFMKGAKSANLYLNFTQNPATWQFGLNVAKFWGGETAVDQPLKDRDFVGAYVSRNF
jgi:hypothetical protein